MPGTNRQREARARGIVDDQIGYNAEQAQRMEAEVEHNEREAEQQYLEGWKEQ